MCIRDSASDTRVEMSFFNQTDIANAKFVVYQGKTRFQVEHPQGQKANYVFVTPTSNIAVRGTEGDIGLDGDTLTVNVYKVSDINLPVEVTYTVGDKQGQSIKLFAGDSLVSKIVNGIIQDQKQKITQKILDQFGEMGLPATADPKEFLDQGKQKAIDLLKSKIPGVPF